MDILISPFLEFFGHLLLSSTEIVFGSGPPEIRKVFESVLIEAGAALSSRH
jgi:hypothetical protein